MRELDSQGRIWYPTDSEGGIDLTRRPQLKRYLDQSPGGVMGTIWTDIPPVNSQAIERIGYPTQKPLPLLTRIVNASSNPGDLVLDPFCGCGTSIEAAQRLARQWRGIDVSHYAVDVIKGRLHKHCEGIAYKVRGRTRRYWCRAQSRHA